MNQFLQLKFPPAILFLFGLLAFGSGAAAQTYNLVVAKDGSGNYLTVQDAIDAAPINQTAPYKIYIKKGKYKEKVTIPSNKPFIQLIGEDVARVIISFDATASTYIPGSTTVTYGTSGSATLTVNASDFMAMNITVENASGYTGDGPQALALNVGTDRCVFKNCRFIGGQDTVLANGNGKRQYFRNCYIDGNTDFIFGSSIAIFDSCTIYPRDRVDGSSGGYVTAVNTPAGQTYGYVFRGCKIPNNHGVTTYTLGRPWQNSTGSSPLANNKVVFLNTQMSASVNPVGWSTWDAGTITSLITYAEYKSRRFDGSLTDVSQRVAWSYQLSDADTSHYNMDSVFSLWHPSAVWTDVNNYIPPVIALANFRAQRLSTSSNINGNLSFPIAGVTYNLFRSTDSINFTQVNTTTIASDTVVAYSFSDVLPASGVSYYYYVTASKTGMIPDTTDIKKINTAIPVNGDFRSAGSGYWGNATTPTATATISNGAVTAITLTAGASGYTTAPTIAFTGGGGTGAAATVNISADGYITGFTITNGGAGYTSAPAIAFTGSHVSIWEKYFSSSSSWVLQPLGTAPSNANTQIRTGNTIIIDALKSINNLTIDSGAVLKSNGGYAATPATTTLRVGTGTATAVIITNNGLWGGNANPDDMIVLEYTTSCASVLIRGTGVTKITRLRPLYPNANVLNVTFDQDINLSYNSGGFTAYYNNASNTTTESVIYTINSGKTVRMSNANGFFNATPSNTTPNPGGTYVYNINGTLDLSATTVSSYAVPFSTNANSSITINVNGSLLLGTGFVTVNGTPSASANGKAYFNIGDGGVVDATRTTNLTMGNTFWSTTGSGYLKRTVLSGGGPVVFPVGAVNAITGSPINLTNTGVTDTFFVKVKDGIENALFDTTKAVRKQWTIAAANNAGANLSIDFNWLSTDQAANFNIGNGVSVVRYASNTWNGNTATYSGAGTATTPYIATATGYTSFGSFALLNSNVSLPLRLLSFEAAKSGKDVAITWKTAEERDIAYYVVEKSEDGNTFHQLESVNANNQVNTTAYQLVDKEPMAGTHYYRLRIVGVNDDVTYSHVARVVFQQGISVSFYPNPATSLLTVTHDVNAIGSAAIYSLDGKLIKSISIASGTGTDQVDVASLSPGTYRLAVDIGSSRSNYLFVKQ